MRSPDQVTAGPAPKCQAEKPRHEVLGEGRRRGESGTSRATGCEARRGRATHADDLGLDRRAIRRWARHAGHAALRAHPIGASGRHFRPRCGRRALHLAFPDRSVKPELLRTTPAKKPRTECCCQPVAFVMAAIGRPLGLSKQGEDGLLLGLAAGRSCGKIPCFAALFAPLLARANLVFVGVLLSGICGSLSVATTQAPSPRNPAVAPSPAGRIPMGQSALSRHGDSDAPIAAEVHSFSAIKFTPNAPAFASKNVCAATPDGMVA